MSDVVAVEVVLACTGPRCEAVRGVLAGAPGLHAGPVVADVAGAVRAVRSRGGRLLVLDASAGEPAVALVRAVMDAVPLPVLVLDAGLGAGDVEALMAAGVVEVRAAGDRAGLAERCRVLAGVAVVRRPLRSPATPDPPRAGRRRVLAVAASTGGPPALVALLRGLGGTSVPVLVVQHIVEDFTPGLAQWLAQEVPQQVVLAQDGEQSREGVVHLAPGGRHLRLRPGGRLSLSTAPAGLHVPSADELLSSVAACGDVQGIGVLLTGMGRDGAEGLLALRRAGGRTLVQDEQSSTVWGMPRAAHDLGAAEQVLPLEQIAPAVRALLAVRS